MRGTRMIQADIIAKRRMKERLDSSPDWYRCFVPDAGFVLDHELIERDLHVLRRTPKRCSCWQCGNPRRYRGETTMQEKRSLLGDFTNEGWDETPYWEEAEFGPATQGSDVARIIP